MTPSLDQWLREARADASAPNVGMYLTHCGVVRRTPRAAVRDGAQNAPPVAGMLLSCDRAKVDAAIAETYRMPGIYYVRVWINTGHLTVGEDMMRILIGGDIRPHVTKAMQSLLTQLKQNCLQEQELPEPDPS